MIVVEIWHKECGWDWCHLYLGRWFGFGWERNCFGWDLCAGFFSIHRSYPNE